MRNTTYMNKTIDDLGKLQARIAKLELEEERLKTKLRKLGPGAYEARLFRAVISEDGEVPVFDVDWAKRKLGPRLCARHTEYVPKRGCVRLYSRNGKKVGAQ